MGSKGPFGGVIRLEFKFRTPGYKHAYFTLLSEILLSNTNNSYFEFETDEIFGNDNFGDNATTLALTINYGKQVVIGDIMSLDWHVGLGYGYSSIDNADYYYRHILSSRDFPLAWTAGFTLGVLLR